MLAAILPELAATMAHRQIFRTETEARVSVLDDLHHPTRAAKYWQALREQAAMLEQLVLLDFEYRRNEVNIQRQERTITTAGEDEFVVAEAQIALEECLFKRANMQVTAADRAREILMWSQIKGELDDGSFDTVNPDTHQLVSYTTRFALSACSVNQSQMTAGEYQNLMGQLHTAVRHCKDRGVLEVVAQSLPRQFGEVVLAIGNQHG